MNTSIKRRALHRTKILQGQIKGLEKMIDQDTYCMDIITQSLAIQKSLSSLNKLIVENHILTHITHSLSSKDTAEKEKAMQELLGLYELANRRGK